MPTDAGGAALPRVGVAGVAELDIDARVDRRSLEAQGIDLEPQHKIGPAASRMAGQEVTSERVDEHHAIARENGDKLLAKPGIAIEAITRTQATFTTRGHVHAALSRDDARTELIDRWERDRAAAPEASRIILTHTNDEGQALNTAARERLRGAGALGKEVAITTERGERAFAPGERIMFLRNERSLGVKNGSLGQVTSVTSARMAVMLDDGRAIAFHLKDYHALDHGYAAIIHKAQGMPVDRVQLLATPGVDRHAAYVALPRYRNRVDLHYGQDDLADQARLAGTLGRERGKDMASDYVRAPADELGLAADPPRRPPAGPLQQRSSSPAARPYRPRHVVHQQHRQPVAPNCSLAGRRSTGYSSTARAIWRRHFRPSRG